MSFKSLAPYGVLLGLAAMLLACGPLSAPTPTVSPPTDTATPAPLATATDLVPIASPTEAPTHAVTKAPTASPPPTATFRPLALQPTPLQGEDVLQIETKLLEWGYAEVGEPDEIFDAQTSAAVKHFQLLNGLLVNGIVETDTLTQLNAPAPVAFRLPPPFPGHDLSRLTQAPMCDNHALQEKLSDLGYLDVKEEEWALGQFGVKTEIAVKQFQMTNLLNPDGIVTFKVWEKLFSPLARAAQGTGPLTTKPWLSTIYALGEAPIAMALDGARLWVARADNTVVMLDPTASTASAPIALSQCADTGERANYGGVANIIFARRLWALFPNATNNQPYLQAANASGLTGQPVPFGNCAEGACNFPATALGFDGAKIWASGGDQAVAIDPNNGQSGASRGIGWQATAPMTYDGKCFWFIGEGGLTSFSPTEARCPQLQWLPAGPTAFDGQRLWIANVSDNSLMVVNLAKGEIVYETISVGQNPSALAFDGRRIWVANALDNTIQAIDTRTLGVSEPLPVGRNPSALLFDGKRLWVLNKESQTVQYLDPTGVKIPAATPPPTRAPQPTATATLAVTDTPTAAPLSRNLSLQTPSLTGEDVTQLQQRLVELAYIEVGKPDGSFGKKTDAAVRHFQEVNELVVDGVVGPKTWALLFSAEARGPAATTPVAGDSSARPLSLQTPPLTGADVRQLQTALWKLNYLGCRADEAVVDGSFGKLTEAAVRRFQTSNGLEANGVVGTETWAKLNDPAAVPYSPGPVTLPPSVSLPSGTAGMIAVVKQIEGNWQIFVMDADLGSLPSQLTTGGNNYDPAWAPDSGRIAYISDQSGQYEIYVASGDGTGAVQLTCSAEDKATPAWSPDGTQLVFAAKDHLYVIKADGTGLTQLPTPPRSSDPTWLRTGQIAFVSKQDGDSDLYLINADGSGLQALTSNGVEDSYPANAPEGRILFTANRNGTTQLFVMNADGSDQRQLTTLDYSSYGELATLINPDWAPDGAHIVFQLSGAGSLLGRVNADGTGLIWYEVELLLQPAWKP